MRKNTVVAIVLLFAASMLLSGCIVPYWWDDWGHGHGHRHGGRHYDDGGGHRGGGRH